MPFALSGTPQHPKRARNPPFFFLREPTAEELGSDLPGVAVGPVPTPKRLLDALPSRVRRNILPLDSLERRSMLTLGSLAVAPLSPVAVGEGCAFWEDDLEGTGRRPLPFFDAVPSSDASASFSFELSAAAWGFSSLPRAMLPNEASDDGSSTNSVFFGRDRVSMGSSHKAGAATIGAGRAFRARRSAATSVGQLGQQHLCAAGFNYAPRRHVRSLDYRRTVAAARHASAAQVSSLCAAVCGRVPPSAWCSLGQPTSIPGADVRSSPATAQPLIQLIRRTIAADLRVSGLLPRYRRRFFFFFVCPVVQNRARVLEENQEKCRKEKLVLAVADG